MRRRLGRVRRLVCQGACGGGGPPQLPIWHAEGPGPACLIHHRRTPDVFRMKLADAGRARGCCQPVTCAGTGGLREGPGRAPAPFVHRLRLVRAAWTVGHPTRSARFAGPSPPGPAPPTPHPPGCPGTAAAPRHSPHAAGPASRADSPPGPRTPAPPRRRSALLRRRVERVRGRARRAVTTAEAATQTQPPAQAARQEAAWERDLRAGVPARDSRGRRVARVSRIGPNAGALPDPDSTAFPRGFLPAARQ